MLLAVAAASAAAIVGTAHNTKLNADILVTGSGLTLYEYVSDVPQSKPFPFCVNDPNYHCSKHWIPLLTSGRPEAKGGAKQSLLGTVKRTDGTTQVTYKGHPLYTWKGGYGGVGDKKAGDVNGQDFLSLWYVLLPTGKVDRKSYTPGQ
jgi:predicted lipoprotein with Yx(FWY)xxD motif